MLPVQPQSHNHLLFSLQDYYSTGDVFLSALGREEIRNGMREKQREDDEDERGRVDVDVEALCAQDQHCVPVLFNTNTSPNT